MSLAGHEVIVEHFSGFGKAPQVRTQRFQIEWHRIFYMSLGVCLNRY